MEKIQAVCTRRLRKIFKDFPNVDTNILKIITEFLHHTDMKTGSILIDRTWFIPAPARFRTASRKLFVVTRRTKKNVYIKELTPESRYRARFFNKLGQMTRVLTHVMDNLDRVWIYVPGEIPNGKIFVRLTDSIKDLSLPPCMIHKYDTIKQKYKHLSRLFC